MAIIRRYEDYKDKVPEGAVSHTPYFPKWVYPLDVKKLGDKIKRFNRWWIHAYRIDFAFSTPGKTKYVNRYCLEFLARFKGRAATRRLHVWSLFIGAIDLPYVSLRLQSQEKIKPIEGEWTNA